jgi:small-conductance mechanosensitive channel
LCFEGLKQLNWFSSVEVLMHYLADMFSGSAWQNTGISLALLAAALLAGLATTRILYAVLTRIAKRTRFVWDDLALRHGQRPAGLLITLMYLNLALPLLRMPPGGVKFVSLLMNILLILAFAYGMVSTVRFLRALFLSRYDVTHSDNLLARKMHTQVGVLEKVALTIIAVLTLAFMLMTIPGVRQVGVSLLASAGIAGIVIGLAAQKSIGTLLAGIQIALTQPIRIDDVVIVEGEWGRVEEITLTYVVVRIWDLRRLVLPVTYFLEQPFQNWTRVSADLLGTVFLHTDYTVSVDALRAEFKRLLEGHPLWDGKVCVVHVTDSKPETMELRLLLSTRDASDGWDLRCHIREKMIDFLQREYPASLPRMRVELNAPPADGRRDGQLPAG